MKMTYERPMMSAEVYQTNAYCGACTTGTPTLLESITTGIGDLWKWFNPRTGNTITPNTNSYSYEHTFAKGEAIEMTSQASGFEGTTQYYWKCTGTDGYYLEYSAEWGAKYGNNTFVLFKEDSNNDQLDVNWYNWGSFPDTNNRNGTDIAVAAVTVYESQGVENS